MVHVKRGRDVLSFDALQQAIDANRPGDVILVPEGEHEGTGTLKEGVWVVGDGATIKGTLTWGTGARLPRTVPANAKRLTDASPHGEALKEAIGPGWFVIVSPEATVTGKRAYEPIQAGKSLGNDFPAGSYLAPISMHQGGGISGVTMADPRDFQIKVSGAIGFRMTNCTLKNAKLAGAFFELCTNVMIEDCLFADGPSAIEYSYGATLSGCRGVEFRRCTADNVRHLYVVDAGTTNVVDSFRKVQRYHKGSSVIDIGHGTYNRNILLVGGVAPEAEVGNDTHLGPVLDVRLVGVDVGLLSLRKGPIECDYSRSRVKRLQTPDKKYATLIP